jgi:transposase
MDVVHPRGCGSDVHKQTVVACLLCSTAEGTPSKDVRTFGTMTADLLRLLDWLVDWLVAAGCTHVAIEVDPVAWRPVGLE